MELFQWFVRSHIEHADGATPADRDTTQRDAAATHTAGLGPTPSEEATADANAPHQPDVSAGYREMTTVGAATGGEGAR